MTKECQMSVPEKKKSSHISVMLLLCIASLTVWLQGIIPLGRFKASIEIRFFLRHQPLFTQLNEVSVTQGGPQALNSGVMVPHSPTPRL